jgi:HD superfamily phosphohydrolases
MNDKHQFNLNSISLKRSKVFRDPIHGYIRVFHLIFWQLINTKEFQRLRRIHQLGGTHMVYQTAEHSRLSHSLGVYEVIRRMLEEETISDKVNDYDKMSVLCAGLLHDVGHGPFSHAFENIFEQFHEDYTVKIILSKDTEINRVLSTYHQDLPNEVASIILKKHHNPILIQLISSQLDGDRMDYLLRDSYFTGTKYGQFDMERIFRTILLHNNRIVIKESGVQAVENYILARYHMYWQVYYHPVARSYEQLLITIFKRIKHLVQDNRLDLNQFPYLIPFFKSQDVSVDDYLRLDEASLSYYFSLLQLSEDAILSDLTNRFMHRKLFKYKTLKSQEEAEIIKKEIKERGYDPEYYVLMDDPQQTPYTHYGADQQVQEIKVLMDYTNEIKTLPEVSEIVSAIVDSKVNKIDRKIYFPK